MKLPSKQNIVPLYCEPQKIQRRSFFTLYINHVIISSSFWRWVLCCLTYLSPSSTSFSRREIQFNIQLCFNGKKNKKTNLFANRYKQPKRTVECWSKLNGEFLILRWCGNTYLKFFIYLLLSFLINIWHMIKILYIINYDRKRILTITFYIIWSLKRKNVFKTYNERNLI